MSKLDCSGSNWRDIGPAAAKGSMETDRRVVAATVAASGDTAAAAAVAGDGTDGKKEYGRAGVAGALGIAAAGNSVGHMTDTEGAVGGFGSSDVLLERQTPARMDFGHSFGTAARHKASTRAARCRPAPPAARSHGSMPLHRRGGKARPTSYYAIVG